jgi:hypothetical protein
MAQEFFTLVLCPKKSTSYLNRKYFTFRTKDRIRIPSSERGSFLMEGDSPLERPFTTKQAAGSYNGGRSDFTPMSA